ncbi:MAG: Ldh family oxidoreductase [Alphaproteobacteria bacterium]|nr:Ldh family oxidoreductase [Alphaproteobacteria bacterium]
MSESRRYPVAGMIAFTRDALAACGVPAADAAIAAEKMIEADLTGFDAHGIFRLGFYVSNLRQNRVNPRADIKVLERAPSTALLDGDNGIGHLVITAAAKLAMDMAGETGIGWVGVRYSNHAGAAGIYPEMIAARGMVGMYAAVSTANHMALWGSAEALLGTNPISIAIPAGKEAPVVLDIATSVASYGTIRQYQIAGTPMPDGWVVHKETGQPVNDPKKVGEGVLLPIGGHKGSGLALIIGMLAGVLNGAAFARDVVDATGPGSGASNTGQFVLALDVSRFMSPEAFKAEVDRQLNDLRSSPKLPGFDAIRIPGEDRKRRKAERIANGVALPPRLVQEMDELAASLKVAPLAARV